MRDCIVVGAAGFKGRSNYEPRTLAFGVGSKEYLRFEDDGKIFAYGQLIRYDKEIVDAMRDFLEPCLPGYNPKGNEDAQPQML